MTAAGPDPGETPAAASLDEICVTALAEAFRGDGEILGHPMGPVPVIAGRLARASFEPDLMLTDTIAYAVTGDLPWGAEPDSSAVECYMPFRTVFDQVWSGRRHVVMGASQIDRHGNQNIAAIGDYRRPKAQLLGLRGAPGNVINHTVSYWVPNQARSFVNSVDVVSGPGYDRTAGPGRADSALPRDPPGGDRVGRLRLRDPRAGHAPCARSTPASALIRPRPPPRSSWRFPTRCR